MTLVAGRLGSIVAAPAFAIASDLLRRLRPSGVFASVTDRRLVSARSGGAPPATDP